MLKPKCECEALATKEKQISWGNFLVKMKILHDHGAGTKRWRSQKAANFQWLWVCLCARCGKLERMPTCCYTHFFWTQVGLKLAKKVWKYKWKNLKSDEKNLRKFTQKPKHIDNFVYEKRLKIDCMKIYNYYV